MTPVGPLDEAELRLEFRRTYKELGEVACTQILYELLMSAQILCEVMQEEQNEEEN